MRLLGNNGPSFTCGPAGDAVFIEEQRRFVCFMKNKWFGVGVFYCLNKSIVLCSSSSVYVLGSSPRSWMVMS